MASRGLPDTVSCTRHVFGIAGAILLAMLLCVYPAEAAAQYLIKFSHVVAPDAPKGKAARYFADQVNRRLAGRVRVEVYPNSSLYNDDTVMSALRLSGGDTGIMAAPSLSKFTDFSGQLQVFDLPFLFGSIEDVHLLQASPLAQDILQPLRRKGLAGLAFWDNGMSVFSVRAERPLRRPVDDFNGLRFRIQNSNVHEAMVKALGGTPRKLPFNQVRTALAKGVVDGQDNTWSNIYSQGFPEYQTDITVSGHAYLGYLVVVSAAFWDQLPANIRVGLTEILGQASAKAQEFASAAALKDRAAIEAEGKVNIIELSAEERALWKKATASVEKRFENQIGAALLKDVHRLLDGRE